MPATARSVAEALRAPLTGDALGQLLRFAVAGVGVTLLSVAIYLTAVAVAVDPMAANVAGHLVGVLLGYIVHSRWSFRAATANDPAAMLRFVTVSGVSFALNSAWVLLATQVVGAAWAAAPAMLFVTPLASFALNRYWVFRRPAYTATGAAIDGCGSYPSTAKSSIR